MKVEAKEAEQNKALLVPVRQIAGQILLPALPVSTKRSVSVGSVAPAFQAERLAEAEKERRRKDRQEQRELKRQMRARRAARRALFTVD